MKIDAPISTRITRIVVFAVGFGIASSVGLFLLSDFRQTMKAEASRYQSAAYAFAAAASDGVAEKDPRKILEVLRGVREMTDVVYIAAKDSAGSVIAEIGAGARLVRQNTSVIPTSIQVHADVRKAGTSVGSIEIQAEVTGLWDRYFYSFLFAALLGIFLVTITALIARLQVSRVVGPLRSLADEFLDIGRRSDLNRRLSKLRNDEVGVLVDAFNEMFGHIEDRDRLLREHSETLERTVETRTSELRLAKNEADAANEAKSAFLATMSHEIRTPMNGMMVMAEMLAAAPLSPRHLRYAEIITRSGKNLLHIINDVLDFSKIESGRIELEEIEFSIDAVVEDVASLFAERAREKELSLAVYIAPNVPLRHIGDPVRLSQIVGNLVNNGLKFTQRGGVTISVELDRLESKRLLCIVEDTGIGIPKDQVDRIFSRFSQADSTISRKFGGTGLGLSISKQLAELMGGIVRVESSIGLGSQFTVSLPLLVAEEATPYWVAKNISAAILDSDPVTRETTVLAFQDRGVSIVDDFHMADMVVVKAGDQISSSLATTVAPIVLLRPFAATTAFPVTGRQPDLEISMPVARKSFDRLLQSFEIGHLSYVDLEATSDAAPTIPDLKHLNILAVDDVAVNREVLGEALRAFNISCDLADSGPTAIERASDRAYDVIFMDCSMPGMDGFEATREIRRLEQDAGRKAAFIVALTGHVMGKEADAWKQAGMDGYLAKPFNMHQLLETFRSCELVSGNGQHELRKSGEEVDALLSADMLEMFENIRVSTGTNLKQKVFDLFSASAVSSYEVAAAEIRSRGPEAKRLIHALKSSCSSSGALRATVLCQKIETTIAEARNVDDPLLQSLYTALLETIESMRTVGGDEHSDVAAKGMSVSRMPAN